MITHITNFLLTLFLWSITGGIYHIPFAFFLMALLFKLWNHQPLIKAIYMSFFFNGVAFLIFYGALAGPLIWWYNVPYLLPENSYYGTFDHLNISLVLAACYSAIEIIQLSIMRRWVHLIAWRVIACIICANVMSALLVYKINFTP